jgi:hypothetical protein
MVNIPTWGKKFRANPEGTPGLPPWGHNIDRCIKLVICYNFYICLKGFVDENLQLFLVRFNNGSFQKRSTLPPRRKFLPSGWGGKTKLFLIIVNVFRTSEGGRGVNFQFPPWGWYGCFLE